MKRWVIAAATASLLVAGAAPVVGQPIDETELRGENIRLREDAGDDAAELAVLQGGELVEVNGEPVLVDGHAWWPVLVVETGDEGWVRWEFLVGGAPEAVPIAAEPEPEPEPAVEPTPEPQREPRQRRQRNAAAEETPEAEPTARPRRNQNEQGGGGRRQQEEATAEPTAETGSGGNRGNRNRNRDQAQPTAAADGTLVPEETADPTPTPEPTEEPADEENGAAAVEGTRQNPIPPGETGDVGDWEARVTGFQRNATDAVLNASDENEEPRRREQYARVEIELTYVGPDEGDPADLVFAAVGDSEEVYRPDACEPPDPIDLDRPFDADEERAGNLCFLVTQEDAPTLTFYAEENQIVDPDERVWFALRE